MYTSRLKLAAFRIFYSACNISYMKYKKHLISREKALLTASIHHAANLEVTEPNCTLFALTILKREKFNSITEVVYHE